jgi:hypothetical protein
MSNTPNRASNPAGKPRKKETTLDLATARQMLPLVRSIVMDIVTLRRAINRLTPEQERLDRQRRELAWQERQRRYQVADEIATAEKEWAAAVTELSGLGVTLVDDEAGEVDFPTKVNGRTAAFSWTMGEEGLRHWHYTGEESRRPIPTDWDSAGTAATTPIRFRGQP